ncbi:response regulator [Bradyrhizobium sp. HKCCYLS1011]|uniref:response regulator n=1 Tax=Bradyrhizobium sp. HKCCYLS1011 TaxID=3420733 RepID=UPI003EB695FF
MFTSLLAVCPQNQASDGVEFAAARSMRILVADENQDTCHMIVSYLREQQIAATGASERHDVMDKLVAQAPGLLILDLQFGSNSGLDLLREIRSNYDVAVITMGYPCKDIDPVIGLEIGADDYLKKPFSMRELLARIQAILRRKPGLRSGLALHPRLHCYEFSGWHLDPLTRRLTSPDGRPVAITKSEYALLLAFLRAPRRLLSRQALLRATHVHEDIFDRTIDVQVMRLRRKLTIGPDAPPLVKTERGLGYVFTSAVDELERDIPGRLT